MKKTIIPPIPSPRVYSRASIVNHVHAQGHTRNIWWLVKSNVCTCVCVCVLSSTISCRYTQVIVALLKHGCRDIVLTLNTFLSISVLACLVLQVFV